MSVINTELKDMNLNQRHYAHKTAGYVNEEVADTIKDSREFQKERQYRGGNIYPRILKMMMSKGKVGGSHNVRHTIDKLQNNRRRLK